MTQQVEEARPIGRRRAIAAALVFLVIGAVIAIVVLKRDSLPEDAAFRYDELVVSEDQLDERLRVLEALYGVKRPSEKSKQDSFNRDAAKSMVVSLVLADAAEDRDIVISDKEAQTELDKLVDDQLTGGRAAFVQFLSSSGISEREVLAEIRSQIATSRLVAGVTADVPPATEEEARKTYDENKADMVTPEGRHLVNIVVENRADADRVAEQARRTGNLGPLAATWSLDGSTRDKGGDLGVVTREQLEKGYGDLAFKAAARDIFGPVRTASGWNVGQVLEIVPARPVAFADVKAELIERLTAQAQLKVWRSFLARTLRDAEVDYADDYQPEDPDAPPADVTQRPSDQPTTSPTD